VTVSRTVSTSRFHQVSGGRSLGCPDGRLPVPLSCSMRSVCSSGKNPSALIDAFLQAKSSLPKDARLVLKSFNADKVPQDHAEILRIAQRVRPSSFCRATSTGPRSTPLVLPSIATCRCNRSEGFGLTLAESMFLGKPVIATGWSSTWYFHDAVEFLAREVQAGNPLERTTVRTRRVTRG